jgi:Domain of unknown function (DUF4124)
MSGVLRLSCACLLAAAVTGAWGQRSIFTCVDARGQRLTSDRPIPECSDREQRELNPSGTVRRVVPPSLTASERAAQEERERRAAGERQRLAEQKRIEKLLVARYPHQALHDADRARALQAAEDAVASGHKRMADLREERRKLDLEIEFYRSPAQWPPQLKRKVDDNEQQLAAQQRFISSQEEEKRRIAQRYDDELARLKRLWAAPSQAAASEGAPVAR